MVVSSLTAVQPHRSLAVVVGVQLVTYAAAAIGFLAVSIQAARLLEVDDFGYFVSAMAACFLAGQAILFGTHRIGLRDAAIAASDPFALSEVLAQTRLVSRALIPAASAAVLLILVVVLEGNPLQRLHVGLLATALVAVTAWQRLWSSFLRGVGSQTSASLLDGASGGPLTLLTQAALFAVYALTHHDLNIVTALTIMTVGQAPWAFATWLLVRRRVDHDRRRSASSLRGILAKTWRFSILQLTAYAGASVEVWIATFCIAAAGVSLLGGAQRLSIVVITPLTAIQVVVSPVIARKFAQGDLGAVRDVVRGGGGAAIVSTLPLLLPMLIVPGAVLGIIFGPDFAKGGLILVVLAIGQLVNLVTGLCGPLLSMTGNEGSVVKIMLVALALRVAIGVPVALTLGLTALVVAGASISAASWLVVFVASRRLTGVSPRPSLRIGDLWALRTIAG